MLEKEIKRRKESIASDLSNDEDTFSDHSKTPEKGSLRKI